MEVGNVPSSTSDGYHTIDRIQKGEGGTDESVTQSQVDVSRTTPYTEGFRKHFVLQMVTKQVRMFDYVE